MSFLIVWILRSWYRSSIWDTHVTKHSLLRYKNIQATHPPHFMLVFACMCVFLFYFILFYCIVFLSFSCHYKKSHITTTFIDDFLLNYSFLPLYSSITKPISTQESQLKFWISYLVISILRKYDYWVLKRIYQHIVSFILIC